MFRSFVQRSHTRHASPAGLTRGSIAFLRRRWIAGSSPAMTISSLRRDNVAPGMPRDLDEDSVAILVDAFGIIPLQANALDDVELSRALPKIDAGRPPRRRQDFGRKNLKVIVQDIGSC